MSCVSERRYSDVESWICGLLEVTRHPISNENIRQINHLSPLLGLCCDQVAKGFRQEHRVEAYHLDEHRGHDY
jgi:hypothetical protein